MVRRTLVITSLAALVGCRASADKAGDSAKARAYYQKVLSIAANADQARVEVADARAFLAKTQ